MYARLALSLILLVALTACQKVDKPMTNLKGDSVVKMTVKSSAFEEGAPIPAKYACDGPGVSPPLEWSGAPSGVKSFAILVDDPDAPGRTFTHWTVYAVPSDVMKLPEDIPHDPQLKTGIRQGKNDGGKIGYYPPAPPFGTHRYQFKLYALDSETDLKAGASVAEFKKAIDGHIIGEGQLMGKYKRL
jgi:hypothetical protein